MSFKAELIINAKESGALSNALFNIISTDYAFDIPVDGYGRVVSRRKFGIINMEIETVPNVVILHQILGTHDKIEGSLIFYMRDSKFQKMLEVKFERGHVIYLQTVFNNNGESPLRTFLNISAEKITIEAEGKSFEDSNDWDSTEQFS